MKTTEINRSTTFSNSVVGQQQQINEIKKTFGIRDSIHVSSMNSNMLKDLRKAGVKVIKPKIEERVGSVLWTKSSKVTTLEGHYNRKKFESSK